MCLCIIACGVVTKIFRDSLTPECQKFLKKFHKIFRKTPLPESLFYRTPLDSCFWTINASETSQINKTHKSSIVSLSNQCHVVRKYYELVLSAVKTYTHFVSPCITWMSQITDYIIDKHVYGGPLLPTIIWIIDVVSSRI